MIYFTWHIRGSKKYEETIYQQKDEPMKQILSTALQKIEQLENEKFAQPNPGSEETKTNLQNRFKNLRAGNQIISGPCSLYAATTAINEFRDKTNPGQIIQRLPDDNRIYSAVQYGNCYSYGNG